MNWDELAIERAAEVLFRLYQSPPLRTHRWLGWADLAEQERSDWKYDALLVFNQAFPEPEPLA